MWHGSIILFCDYGSFGICWGLTAYADCSIHFSKKNKIEATWHARRWWRSNNFWMNCAYKGLFTLNAKIGAKTLLNRNDRSLMRLFTPSEIIRAAKKWRFVFFVLCWFFFSPSLCDEAGRPIRFELRSRARSSCCCTKGWAWWRCF